MKLMKATLPRLGRLARTTSIVVALAVLLALVAGVASLAVAKPTTGGGTGGATPSSSLLLGVKNSVTAWTSIEGILADPNPILRLVNTGTGPALDLQVQADRDAPSAPMTVNSDTVVDNLHAETADNANTVDGKDSTGFLGATAKAADSDKLDSKDSTEFAAATTAKAYAAAGGPTGNGIIAQIDALPQGEYVIMGSVTAGMGGLPGEGDVERPGVFCAIKGDGQTLISTSEEITENGAENLSVTSGYRTGGGTTRLTWECTTGPALEPTHTGNLTAIRVSSMD